MSRTLHFHATKSQVEYLLELVEDDLEITPLTYKETEMARGLIRRFKKILEKENANRIQDASV